jgi:hypothetical protein
MGQVRAGICHEEAALSDMTTLSSGNRVADLDQVPAGHVITVMVDGRVVP